MAEAKLKIWLVTQANADAGTQTDEGATRKRLVRAKTRAEVGAYLLSEVTIEIASQEDLIELAKTCEVEKAGEWKAP